MAAEVLFPNRDHNNVTYKKPLMESIHQDVKPSTIRTWQKFIDFLLRQLSQVSLKYTDWENDEFDCFCQGLNFVEALGIKGSAPAMSLSDLRKQAKLLGEHKVKSDLENRDKYGEIIDTDRVGTPDPEPILNYLDLLARLRGLSNVAGDFQKSLKKAQMPNIEEQAQVQKYWKAMALPRVDLSNIQPKDTDAGIRSIWTGLTRTILNLSFQFLQKASWTSGIKLQADAEQVAFNLTDEEIQWAKKIVDEIDKQLQKQYGNLDANPKSADDDLSALLNKLGAAETDNPEREIIGLTDDGTLVLPDEPPKQKPIGKKKKSKAKRGTSATTKGHHRKTKK